MPTKYRPRVLGTRSIEDHIHQLHRTVRQMADRGEIETPTKFRSSSRRTRRPA